MIAVSAYIPCLNSEKTIAQSISSLRAQTISPAEIFVIDDGSIDRSAEIARQLGVETIKHESTMGRGFVRSRAMNIAKHEFVLCLDSNKILCSDFIEKSLPWLEDKTYAGVRAHLVEDGGKANSSVYIRWRARHITREGKDFSVSPNSPLITSAAILRKSTVLDLGNYNSHMTHSEDRDLSERLEKAGYHIGFDPALWVKYIGEENLGKLLDRYWRWTSCDNLEFTFLDYIKNFNYVVKHMCSKDIKDHDPCSCLISLLSPHYLYWRTKFEKLRHKEAAN